MTVTLKMVTISWGKNYKYYNFMLYPSVMVSMVPETPNMPHTTSKNLFQILDTPTKRKLSFSRKDNYFS